MDISPGSTPTEESMMERRNSEMTVFNTVGVTTTATPSVLTQSVSCVTPSCSTPPTVITSIISQRSAPDKSLPAGGATAKIQSMPHVTVLNTLTALQQALSQVIADKATTGGVPSSSGSSTAPRTTPPSILSTLALLPAMITQLGADKSSQTSSIPHADQQQITQQGLTVICIFFSVFTNIY